VSRRVKVQLFGRQNRSISIDPDASSTVVLGKNIVWPDGTVVQPGQITNTSTDPVETGPQPTLWSLILGIPAFIKALALLTGVGEGLVVKRPTNTAALVTLTPFDERILITNGDAIAGDPVFGAYDWPSIKTTVEAVDVALVQTGFQALVWDQIKVNLGGSLTVDGTMVVLGDQPDPDPISPDFTYGGGGELTQIDYPSGEQKIFTYNGSGDLTRLDYIRDGVTLRKDFTYLGGDLDFITETYLDV